MNAEETAQLKQAFLELLAERTNEFAERNFKESIIDAYKNKWLNKAGIKENE